MALFQFSLLIRPKNSKKKLVKSWFHYCRFLSLVTAVYLQLVLLYIYFSRELNIKGLGSFLNFIIGIKFIIDIG